MYRLGQSGMVSALHGGRLQRAHGVNPAVVLFPLHAHPATHLQSPPVRTPCTPSPPSLSRFFNRFNACIYCKLALLLNFHFCCGPALVIYIFLAHALHCNVSPASCLSLPISSFLQVLLDILCLHFAYRAVLSLFPRYLFP